jgi:hypothetical protein
MPVPCNHEQTASSESTPRSRGPVARLKKNSVGTLEPDVFAVALWDKFVLSVDDISEADKEQVLGRTGWSARQAS